MSRGKAEKKAARAARLSAALRENLKRRKAQARGRADRARTSNRARTSRRRHRPERPPPRQKLPTFAAIGAASNARHYRDTEVRTYFRRILGRILRRMSESKETGNVSLLVFLDLKFFGFEVAGQVWRSIVETSNPSHEQLDPTFGAAGGMHYGSHSHRRRTSAQRHDPDLGGEERHASPDDRQSPDRPDLDAG